MKKYAHIGVCCLLAVVLTMPLVACGDSEDDESSVTKEMDVDTREQLQQLAMESDLLTGELENTTIKWLSDWDINSDDTGKSTPIELAIFQERYGGEVEWYQCTYGSRYDDLANYINSDEGIDFFYGGNWDAFPKGAIRNMFVSYDEYIDLDSELWEGVKEANDALMWNGEHYMAVVEVTGDNCVIIYNRQTMEENGLDDPAELFENDEWTWETFEDMLEEFVDTDEERYGIDSWYFEAGLSASTGVPYIGLEDGVLVNNLRDEALEDYQNWMYDLWQKDYIALGVGDYGWESRDYYIGEGKLLFYPCGLWTLMTEKDQWVETFGEEVMFVPVPRYEEADEYYIPCSVNAYLFVRGGDNPEGVAKYLDCMRFSKISEGAQELSDEQFMEDYEWTDEMIEMYNTLNDMALENPVFDLYNGISSDVTDVLDSSETGIRATSRGTSTWSEVVNSIYDQIQNFIDEANESQDEEVDEDAEVEAD